MVVPSCPDQLPSPDAPPFIVALCNRPPDPDGVVPRWERELAVLLHASMRTSFMLGVRVGRGTTSGRAGAQRLQKDVDRLLSQVLNSFTDGLVYRARRQRVDRLWPIPRGVVDERPAPPREQGGGQGWPSSWAGEAEADDQLQLEPWAELEGADQHETEPQSQPVAAGTGSSSSGWNRILVLRPKDRACDEMRKSQAAAAGGGGWSQELVYRMKDGDVGGLARSDEGPM